uniref:RING-type E3 ubiquitin transferase n=1 Tax=Meloidogyne incognita TaxID=6306 RepID=A0A914LY55_MELIC
MSANAQQQRPLCRYFASNICFKGDNCEFSHDRNAKPDLVCRYYLQGACAYGSRCRFDHVRVTAAQKAGVPNAQTCTLEKISTAPKSPQKPSAKLSINSKPFVPAPIPASNPWNKNAPLNNFHNDLGFELELINGPDIGCSSNDLYSTSGQKTQKVELANVPLCPYFEVGLCQDGDFCRFVHGIPCDMCLLNILHPHNEAQRKKHRHDCLEQHERDMEAAFADARSADKQCGICMELIAEKDLRFAILQNCNHCFCLECIRKWRKQHNNMEQEVEAKTVRACPECRVHSDYVIPSKTWIEDKDEKEKLIKIFHDNTKKGFRKYVCELFFKINVGLTKLFDLKYGYTWPQKYSDSRPWEFFIFLRFFLDFYRRQDQSFIVSIIFQIKCKYIKGSDVDSCPFGNKCFYKHQMPDGTIVEGKSPRTLRREQRVSAPPFLELLEFMIVSISDDSDDGDLDFSCDEFILNFSKHLMPFWLNLILHKCARNFSIFFEIFL